MIIYTVKEVSEMLSVNTETVKRYIYRKDLKAYKVGREWRVEEGDLKRFIFKKSNIEGVS